MEQNLLPKIQPAVTDNELTVFLNDLISYFSILKNHTPTDIKEVIEVCKELFEPYTIPFLKKWQPLGLVTWHSGYAKHYYSIALDFLENVMLLPHIMLIFHTLHPENSLIEQLKACSRPKDFAATLNKVFQDFNLIFLKTDLEIINILLNPLIRRHVPSIPTNRQISKFVNLSENTISRRLAYLYKNAFLATFYRVDMARLGYQTYAIIHLTRVNQLPQSLEPYCLVDVPIDWGDRQAKLKIFQVPFSQMQVFSNIAASFHPLYEITLTKSYVGWNLAGLTCEPTRRWQIKPPILTNGDWQTQWFSDNQGIELDLFNDMTKVSITPTQAKMLDIVSQTTTPNLHLSQTLNITQKYINQFFKDFFAKQLITRFAIVRQVGLEFRVWVTLLGTSNSNCFDLLPSIFEHLKFFPFSYLFFNETNLDHSGRPLLTGLLRLPAPWLNDFCDTWSKLGSLGFTPKINLQPGGVKWRIDIDPTCDFQRR